TAGPSGPDSPQRGTPGTSWGRPWAQTAGAPRTSRTSGLAGRNGGGPPPLQPTAEDESAAEWRRPSAGAHAAGRAVPPVAVGRAAPPRLMTARAVASLSVASGAP